MKTQASLCEISRTLSSALHLPSGTCAFLGEASPEGNLRTSEVQAEGGMRPAEQTLEWRVRPGMDSDLPGEGRPGRGEAWESGGLGEQAQERGGPGEQAQERGGQGERRPGKGEARQSRPGRGEAQVLQSRVFTHIPENPVTNQSEPLIATLILTSINLSLNKCKDVNDN